MKRNYYFDNLKAILIFVVVLAHLARVFMGGSTVLSVMYGMIFSFHMPVFLFVTGYFAKANPKKVLLVLVPLYLVFWLAQYAIDSVVYGNLLGYNLPLKFNLLQPRFTLWYLLATIFFTLMVPLFKTENKVRQVISLIIVVIGAFLMGLVPFTDNFLAIARTVSFMPFLVMGYYCKVDKLLVKEVNGETKITMHCLGGRIAGLGCLVVALAMLALGTTTLGLKSSWFYGTLEYGMNNFTPFSRMYCLIMAFLWVIFLLAYTPQKQIKLISTIGKNTLPVYLLHGLLIRACEHLTFIDTMKGSVVATVILSVLITLFFSLEFFAKLVGKINFMKLWPDKKKA